MKVDLAKDMSVIPFSGNNGETLSQYINSGKLDKLGYEFVGALGSGYTDDNKKGTDDPRLGFIYQDGKVITNNLKQNPLRTGFKVMKDGSIERVTPLSLSSFKLSITYANTNVPFPLDFASSSSFLYSCSLKAPPS